jgi:hypothetical protein
MAQISGLSMKAGLLSFSPVKTLLDTFQRNLGDIRKFFSRVIPSKTISMETVRQDVWRDLSLVYYKYEDGAQKRAFREILSEVSERINDGNWDSVYRKLHRIESTPTIITR